MESGRVIVLNNERSPVKCCFLLHWHIYVGAAGQHSSSLLAGGQVHRLNVAAWLMADVVLSGVAVRRPLPGLFIDLCILFNSDLAWEGSGKWQLILAAFL